jgi:hypothetical protein
MALKFIWNLTITDDANLPFIDEIFYFLILDKEI